jgi:heptosyltransferase-3
LLIQLGDIGDVVLTLPAIRGLRSKFPDVRLVVAVREKARELIEDCIWADDVIAVSKGEKPNFRGLKRQFRFFRKVKGFRFHWAIELRTGTRGAILAFLSGAPGRIARFADDGRLWRNRLFTHLIQAPDERGQYAAEHPFNLLIPMGVPPVDLRPVHHVPPERHQQARKILQDAGLPPDKMIVAMHPFSLWAYKEWTVEGFADLANRTMEHWGAAVIFTGAPDERRRVGELARLCRHPVYNLAGKTSIGQLPAILQIADAFVGVDTAALHMAAAVGTPTVGLFGPSSPISWAPRGAQHQVVSKEMPCVPCRQKGCENREVSRCMQALRVEEVYDPWAALLNKVVRSSPVNLDSKRSGQSDA